MSCTNYTLSYSEGVQGFPSFYSYHPDFMIGMNNYFYSFNQGNLYRHNTNERRNSYYGVDYNSQITSVFNEKPLENFIFKTITLESDDSWSVDFFSDMQLTGFINASSFVKKEGAWFAYLRTEGAVEGVGTPIDNQQYPLRSIMGIMNSTARGGTIANPIVQFDIGAQSDLATYLNPQINVNDFIYHSDLAVATPELTYAGKIQDIAYSPINGIISITIDAAGAVVIPAGTLYFAAVKNQIAESYGVLGHYGRFKLTNSATTPTELFAVESDVMKSYP